MHPLVSSLAESGIALRSWREIALYYIVTLLLDPGDSWFAPGFEAVQGTLHRLCTTQDLGQHVGILHRHDPCLGHGGSTSMGGIADQHDAATVPVVELHLLSGVTVDLVVTRERPLSLLVMPPVAGKLLPKACKATLHRVMAAWHADSPKNIGWSL